MHTIVKTLKYIEEYSLKSYKILPPREKSYSYLGEHLLRYSSIKAHIHLL